MHKRKDVTHMLGHPYFRGSEERHEQGTGLELALAEMDARKCKTAALRAARRSAEESNRTGPKN